MKREHYINSHCKCDLDQQAVTCTDKKIILATVFKGGKHFWIRCKAVSLWRYGGWPCYKGQGEALEWEIIEWF